MPTSLHRYASFFLLAMALGIAPGPDILFVFAQSLAQGPSAGSLVTLGLCTGLCVHVTLAALGFAAVMKRCPFAFQAVTWCGALYLVWLGWGAWRSAVVAVPTDQPAAEALPYLRLYLRGIVMNLCNPKVILFFLALMPRFIDGKKGKAAFQFILLGLTFVVATLIVFNSVALCGGGLSVYLQRWPDSTAVLQRFSAFVMWGLSIWIAWMNCRAPKKEGPAHEAV